MKLPTMLSVIVLASACGEGATAPDAQVVSEAGPAPDASPRPDATLLADAGVGDAGDSGRFDAGCQVFESYDPVTMRCEPVA